jgi:hypothetical protein
MNTLAIKITLILGLLLYCSAFADFYVENIEWEEGEDYSRPDTNKAGMIRVGKHIYYKEKHSYEHIEAIYDRKKNLIFYRRRIFKNGTLVQLDYNGTVRNIISGETRCDFTVIEPSGDSVFFRLDPRKEPKNYGIKENKDFSNSKIPPKDKKYIYDVIIFNRWIYDCQHSAGFN